MIEKQFMKFVSVGLFSTLMNYLVFYTLYTLFSFGYLLSSSTGYIVGVYAGFDQRAKTFTDILSYHTTPEEAADIANKANVDHLIFYHLVPAPRNNLMSRMFVRGVNEIRKDWTISSDGTMVVLPLNSDEIKISSIN